MIWRVKYKQTDGTQRFINIEASSRKKATLMSTVELNVFKYWKERCGGSPSEYLWTTMCKPVAVVGVRSIKESVLVKVVG